MPKKDSKTKDIQTVEQVQEVPLSQIHPFEGHPFKVVDDDECNFTFQVIGFERFIISCNIIFNFTQLLT